MTDLSVIIATCDRPSQLATCLQQLKQQSIDGINIETIVVDESTTAINANTISRFKVDKYTSKIKEGLYGAYAKDIGINLASGQYVCFWDDDNIYYQHALASLYGTAYGVDIGVVRAHHKTNEHKYRTIPDQWTGQFVFKQIDTMCVCVRRNLAEKSLWSNHKESGTDFAWLSELVKYNPVIKYTPLVIGVHL